MKRDNGGMKRVREVTPFQKALTTKEGQEGKGQEGSLPFLNFDCIGNIIGVDIAPSQINKIVQDFKLKREGNPFNKIINSVFFNLD